MKTIFLLLLCLTVSCSVIKYDKLNSNKKFIDMITYYNNRTTLGIVLETDTTINFKDEKYILDMFGAPRSRDTVLYKYPAPNLLWILTVPFEDKIKECPVLMMEWEYKKSKRVVLFIIENNEWVSLVNMLYPSGLEW